MTAWIGLALLPLVGVGILATGWPAFAVLIGVAGLGALVSVATQDAAYLTALPGRLVGLLESDLLQALPLFVLMGALLNRLPLVGILFRTLAALLGRLEGAPRIAALLVGALLAPMCGSVGASVAMLSRAVAPRLAERGTPPDQSFAVVAMAGTLGVVIPPSLVLILLGDALMGAHTLALNISGRTARVLNTHDVFAAAIGPAALLLVLALAVAAWPRRRGAAPGPARTPRPPRPTGADILVSALTLGFVLTVLGGVAAGIFYAVEAAAMGALILLVGGLASRRIDLARLGELTSETLAITGALFALLIAATTFTLVLRGLGSDRLLLDLIAAIPAGERGSALIVLGVLAATAFVLDAFEIIFVVVPLLMPGLLVRVEDATWIAAMTLLTLQASFLLPPIGYAFTMSRAALAPGRPFGMLVKSLAPYLAAALVVLAATFAYPGLAHLGGAATRDEPPALSDPEVIERFRRLAPDEPPPVRIDP